MSSFSRLATHSKVLIAIQAASSESSSPAYVGMKSKDQCMHGPNLALPGRRSNAQLSPADDARMLTLLRGPSRVNVNAPGPFRMRYGPPRGPNKQWSPRVATIGYQEAQAALGEPLSASTLCPYTPGRNHILDVRMCHGRRARVYIRSSA